MHCAAWLPIGRWIGWGLVFSLCSLHGQEVRFQILKDMEYSDPVPGGPYTHVWGVFIGVSQYQNSTFKSLPNASRDAERLSRLCEEKLGMEPAIVLVDRDATLARLEAALSGLRGKVTANDLFLFHFSGHGMGMQDVKTREKTGILLLHDAPSTFQLILGKFDRGVLPMNLLDRILEKYGLFPKHQFFILDSCFSGMAASSRDTMRGLLEQSQRETLERMMQNRATYVLTAGGSQQTVLDGSVEEGHGLLSGFLIKALSNPDAFELKTISWEGRNYLPARQLYDLALAVIPAEAKKIRTEQLRNRDSDPGAVPGLQRLTERNVQEVFSRLQVPQEDRKSGEGWVYLPLQEKEPPPPPAAPPVAPPPSQPDPAPPTAPPSVWQQWAAHLPEGSFVPGLAPIVRQLAEVWREGITRPGAEPLECEVQLLARPDFRVLYDHLQKTGQTYQEPAKDLMGRLQAREQLRQAVLGAQWSPVAMRGMRLPDRFEVGLRLRNRGSAPLYHYLIALDAQGVLQWLAPGPEESSLPSRLPLAQGQTLLLPGAPGLPPSEQPLLGWPLLGGDRQLLLLLVTTRPQPDLERLLRQGVALSPAAESQNDKAADLPLPSAPLCAEMADLTTIPFSAAPGSLEAAPGLAYRTDREWLIIDWVVHVIPPADYALQMKPY